MPVASVRETALQALLSAVTAAAPAGATVSRNETLNLEAPAAGLIIMRDGDPGEPEVTLSPNRYWFRHRVEILIIVAGVTGPVRAAATDTLIETINAAIAADPYLGGAAEYTEVEAPTSDDVNAEAGEPKRGIILPVIVEYESTTPAG